MVYAVNSQVSQQKMRSIFVRVEPPVRHFLCTETSIVILIILLRLGDLSNHTLRNSCSTRRPVEW